MRDFNISSVRGVTPFFEKFQCFLSTLIELLPSTVLLRIRNRTAILICKKPQLLLNGIVRFLVLGVFKVEFATVAIPVLPQTEKKK